MSNTKKQSILWSILNKYDGDSSLNKFCDSISNFIQEKQNGDDILIVYNNLTKIERSDFKKVDEAIGAEIDGYLFSI